MAGSQHPDPAPKPARPSRSLTVAEVRALSDVVPPRYRVLVLVLAFGGLRFGEATALCRADVMMAEHPVALRVERSVRQINGRSVVGPPKSDAGRRTVALPGSIGEALGQHLVAFVGADETSLVFGTSSGSFLARSNFAATFARAVKRVHLDPVRVHELRHTGATLAAGTGASTAELMHRFGHATAAAAQIYQHASTGRDSEIAHALDRLV